MEAIRAQINLGATICEKLKDIYFSNKEWVECHNDIVAKFGELKRIMRKFYTDKSDLDILKELIKYDTMDIEEVFNTETGNGSRDKQFYAEVEEVQDKVS